MLVIQTRNGPISFLETGTGSPIVLIHGIQGTARTWDGIVPLLKDRYRAVAPNLRGRSVSYTPNDPDAYRLREFASDLSAVLQTVGGPALLVAWSMGVSVTLELLRQQPRTQLSGLVLVSGSPCVGREARWFNGTTAAEIEEEARERSRRLSLVETAEPHAVAASWHHIQQADFRDLLPSISYPTLVIHGTADDQCPIGHGRLMAEAIPGAQLDEWPGCGHNPMTSDPARFADAISRFAASLPPSV